MHCLSRENIDAMMYYVNCRNTAVNLNVWHCCFFRVKLKTNLSFSQIASLFNLGSGDSGRMVASRTFQMVTEEFFEKFVLLNFCVAHHMMH